MFAEKYWDATPLHSLVAPTRVEFGSAAASQFLSPDPRPVTNLYMVIFTSVFFFTGSSPLSVLLQLVFDFGIENREESMKKW